MPDTFVLSAELEAKLRGPKQPSAASPETGRPPATPPDDLPPGDPGLREALREWRRQVAGAAELPAYRVLTNAAIEALAGLKPASEEELLAIKGIGPFTVRKYGNQLLELICRHTDHRRQDSAAEAADRAQSEPRQASGEGLWWDSEEEDSGSPAPPDVPRAPAEEASSNGADRVLEKAESDRSRRQDRRGASGAIDFEQRKVKPNFYWTWRLLADGYTAEQCEQIRRLDDRELLSHALQALDQELPVDAEWFLSPEQLAALDEAIGDTPPKRLRDLLKRLPANIRYEHVQLYVRTRWPDGG
jgi:hypothetical protein